jgi:predicted nucleic acid-binding protein
MPINLPAGASCFIDANIFAYALLDLPPFTSHVYAFFQRIINGEVRAFTTSIVLAESLHRVMLAEVAQKFQPTIKPLTYVQKHPEIIAHLAIYPIAIDRLGKLGVELIPVDLNTWKAAAQIAATQRLLTNDACVVATMAIHNI